MQIMVAGRKRDICFGVIYKTDDPHERQKGIYALGQIIVMEKSEKSYEREIGSRCDPHKSGFMCEIYDHPSDAIERSEQIWDLWMCGETIIDKADPEQPHRQKHKKRRDKKSRNQKRRGQRDR